MELKAPKTTACGDTACEERDQRGGERDPRATNLDDAAEVGAEERRRRAGGAAPFGRRRGQHRRDLLGVGRGRSASPSSACFHSTRLDSSLCFNVFFFLLCFSSSSFSVRSRLPGCVIGPAHTRTLSNHYCS